MSLTPQQQIDRYRKIITESEMFIADSNARIEKLWKVEPMTQDVTNEIRDIRIKVAQTNAAIANCNKSIAQLQEQKSDEDCNC